MIFKKKIKSKVIVDLVTSNRCGFSIPVKEQVTMYSLNTKKKDLDQEWKNEGMMALNQLLPHRRVEKVEKVEYFDLKGNQIK